MNTNYDVSKHYDDLTLDEVNRSYAGSAFVCGLLTGALVGLLFAPARGRDTRRRLSSAARDGRDRVSHFVTKNRHVIAEKQARMASLVDHARTRVERTTSEAAAAMKHARAAIDHALDRTS